MRIQRQHQLGISEVRTRINALADDLKRQFRVDARWAGDRLEVSGSGVDGHLDVSENAVDLNLRLGFAMKLMESNIRAAVEKAMDRHLV